MNDCNRCGTPGGALTTHFCPTLSRPCNSCGRPGGADYTHCCSIPEPQVVVIRPVVITVPTLIS